MLLVIVALVVASRGAFVINEAIAVLGQPDFSSSSVQQPLSNSSLNAPRDLVLDEEDNLYVADTGHLRVLFFQRDLVANRFSSSSASRVYGAGGGRTSDERLASASRSTSMIAPRCKTFGYQSIEAIALDARDGSLWVSDGGASCYAPRVWLYPKGVTTSSQILTFSVCAANVIQSMAFANQVFVLDVVFGEKVVLSSWTKKIGLLYLLWSANLFLSLWSKYAVSRAWKWIGMQLDRRSKQGITLFWFGILPARLFGCCRSVNEPCHTISAFQQNVRSGFFWR